MFCVGTIFRGTTFVNTAYKTPRVNNDNAKVPLSYVKVQLNITQFILAAVIFRIRIFFEHLDRDKCDSFLILPLF